MRSELTPTRRDWLRATGGVAVTAATAAALSAEEEQAADNPLIIDCHAHIYGTDEKKYPTIPKPYRPPKGKGTIAHLRREMKAAGVRFVTAIQTSTYYRWDNRFTADSARRHKQFMAGVVTLNPDEGESPELLERYVREYNVKGMRSIPGRSGKLDDSGVARLWATAERLGIVINVLTNRDKLPEIQSLAAKHPRLRIVIDHCLNIKAGPSMKPIVKAMRTLAKIPTCHAKLTFIPTGSAQDYPCKDLHDACRDVIDAFGPNRCVWGSDFPCELWCPKLTYGQHLRIFTHELGLEESAKRDILGRTASKLWFGGREK